MVTSKYNNFEEMRFQKKLSILKLSGSKSFFYQWTHLQIENQVRAKFGPILRKVDFLRVSTLLLYLKLIFCL